MKLAIIHLNLAVEAGDPRMVYLLARNIQKAGHTITVYTAQFDPECFKDLHEELTVCEVPSKLGETVADRNIFQKIAERIGRERRNTVAVMNIAKNMDPDFDVIICENDQSYKLGKIYRATNPNVKVVWIMNNAPFRHTHKDNPIVNLFSIVAGFIEKVRVRHYLPYIDKIVVNDEEQVRLAAEVGAKAQLLLIPVNFELFYRPISFPKGKEPMLLGVGSLTRERCFEDIIMAGAFLRKQGIPCRVALVCKDLWHNSDYRRELVYLAGKDTDGASWVDFRFEGVDDKELFALQAQAFAFIFPNHIKIWGMSAFEAMAAGLPVIVSNSTSVAEALTDGKDALFVGPGRPPEIAQKVQALLSDPKKYEAIAKAGQDFVLEHLTWGAYVKRFLKI